ncbi:MAG: hypothetical protein HUJ51_07030 [Eggerthellaceae bacterium]|nr:hypothetical protein [Eggerthellaceae bacterium]
MTDIFRPHIIKVYLLINLAASKHIGSISTSDSLGPPISGFWNKK